MDSDAYIHTYIHTMSYIHIHIHTYIHTYIQTYNVIHTYTYIHTYIHTYNHTYNIHTYIHTYNIHTTKMCILRKQNYVAIYPSASINYSTGDHLMKMVITPLLLVPSSHSISLACKVPPILHLSCSKKSVHFCVLCIRSRSTSEVFLSQLRGDFKMAHISIFLAQSYGIPLIIDL